MKSDIDLLGYCGLYCGSCPHLLSSFERNIHIFTNKLYKNKKYEGFICKGCRTNRLYKNISCIKCNIKICAQKKNIIHCGYCSYFPCNKIINFQNDGRKHHMNIVEQLNNIKNIGEVKWLKNQKTRWKCKCGKEFSWYEKFCIRCGLKLDSYC